MVIGVSGDLGDGCNVPVNGTSNSTLFCHDIEACYDRIEVFGGVFRCKKFYATLDPSEPCMYDRKSRVVLVLLELFCGWVGAGSFYLELFEMAIVRSMLFVFMLLFIIYRDWTMECMGSLVAVFFYIIVLIWFVFITHALTPYAVDSNGVFVYSL